MFDLKNPIPAASKDTGKNREFWSMMNSRKILVPFVGNNTSTGHSFIKVLRDLTELSDSFAACSRWVRKMVFGGRMGTVDIIEKPIPGFSVREEDNLSQDEKKEFERELRSMGVSLLQIVAATCQLRQHDEESGNHYLRVRVAVVDNVVRIKFIPIHYMHIAYEWTASDRRYFAICKDWSFNDAGEVKWERVPASKIGEDFRWRKNRNGTLFETVVHVPNELDEGDWYGRPWIRSVLTWMFSEYAQGDHRCKTDSSEVVAKKLFAFKREEDLVEFCGNCDEGEKADGTACGCTKKESSFEAKARVFREITTNEGSKDGITAKKPSSIGLVEVDDDLDFPKMYDMLINRDTAWFKEGLEQAAFKIHGNFGVPRQLTKTLQSRSGLSGAELINLYLITDCDTVKPIQAEYENYWGFVFEQIFDLIGRDDLKKYGIKFPDKITPLVEALKQANSKENAKNNTDTKGTD